MPFECLSLLLKNAQIARGRLHIIRQFLAEAISEYKTRKAACLYREGKITISVAAKMTDLTVHEMREFLVKGGHTLEHTMDEFRREVGLLK